VQSGRHVAVFLLVSKNMGAVAPLLSPFTSNIYPIDWSGDLVARVGSSAVPFEVAVFSPSDWCDLWSLFKNMGVVSSFLSPFTLFSC